MMRNPRAGAGRTRPRPANLGMPFRGDPGVAGMPGRMGGGRGMSRGPQPGGMPSRGAPQPDAFAQFNAFQDSNIGGQQPGPVQAGYGGFGALDTMSKIKMNDWLNTLSVGGEREKAMNAIGYNNAGNPYTPQVPKGYNQGMRGAARTNQQTGAYSSPGIYQHQDQAGNYTGITNVGDNGAAQYSPFDVKSYGGRTRRTRTFGDVRY